MNILEEVQIYVQDRLNADEELSGLCPFIFENKRDIDYEIKSAIGKQGIVGLVMTPKATFAGAYEDKSLAWQIDELEIDIIENVTVNRGKKNGFITGQDASMRLFDVLCPLSGDNEGMFNAVSYEEGEDNSLLVNKCVLKCLVHNVPPPPPPPPPPDPTLTRAYYADGTMVERDITTEITRDTFEQTNLVKLEIGSHVPSVEFGAFAANSTLSSVEFNEGTTSIVGTLPFEGCSALTQITIPDSVTGIGSGVFASIPNITEFKFPESLVESIGSNAFTGCRSLSSVAFGGALLQIGDSAFYDCTSLKNFNSNDGVYLYDGTQTIGQYAFYNSGIEKLSFDNGAAMGIDRSAFAGCNQLSDVVVRGVTTHEAMSLENYPWGISNESIIRGDKGI